MVFHLRNDDFIAIVQECGSERMGYEVYRFRSAACKNDFSVVGGMEELLYTSSGVLVSVGGLLAEAVYAAMYVGVDAGIAIGNGFDDAARFLGRGGVVEVYQWFTVYFPGKNGKILPYFMYIQHSVFFNY